MFAGLEAKLSLIGIILAIILVLCGIVYFEHRSIVAHEAQIATLKVTTAMQTAVIKQVQDDAAATLKNQEKLFSDLDRVRSDTAKAIKAMTIPQKLLRNEKSASDLSAWLNAQERAQNAAIEALTGGR